MLALRTHRSVFGLPALLLLTGLLLHGCVRAGFHAAGDTPSDGAADTTGTEASPPDARPGCAPGVPTHSWSRGIGTAGRDYGVTVAVDDDGNVYLAGMFTGTADFGGGDITSNGGSSDIFVASYSSTGEHRWSKGFGGAGEDSGEYLRTDASGNVYLTGSFTGTADFGGGDISSNAGSRDIFVASYSGTGEHRWSRTFGGTASDEAAALALDDGGNLYLVGSFRLAADLGGGLLTSKGMADAFLASYTPTGDHRWSRRLGGSGEDYGSSVAVDRSGNVFATGRFFGSVDFDGAVLSSNGQDDIFVISYTGAGTARWRKRVGGLGEDAPFDVVADGSGNVYVTGRFQESVDFGAGPVSSNGGSDIFVASFSGTGAPRWSRGIGGADDDAGRRLALDRGGNLLVAGVYQGTADPGGGVLTSGGGGDILLASYTDLGTPCWQMSFGDADDQAGYGVAAHTGGEVVLAGWYYDKLSLGGATLSSAGGMDIFVAGFSR